MGKALDEIELELNMARHKINATCNKTEGSEVRKEVRHIWRSIMAIHI